MSENVAAGARRRRLKREGVSPRKSERTRQAILDAALEFLWTQPFRELTVGELMVMAKASRPAFYQYFTDLHQVMEVLLDDLRDEIMSVAAPWLIAEGDPVPLLRESLTGLVKVCYQRGPILRAVADAASADATLEKEWREFLKAFDDAVAGRIEQQQAAGLVPPLAARPIAVALNRLDAALIIDQFGQRPRGNPDDVCESLTRIWISTLYGRETLSGAVTSARKSKRTK